jgi:Icc protein
MVRSIAHLSDLHLGRDARTEAAARRLCAAILAAQVDTVLVTGDVTHRGRRSELRLFEHVFEPLLSRGRVVVVPGNHDRAGEDAGAALMTRGRVEVAALPGLHIVRVDSTAPHNRSLISAHGQLSRGDLEEVDAALRDVGSGTLTAIMLHHHVLPLPPDDLVEAVSSWLGWPNSEEVPEGAELLALARRRCDLVLHGHRHVPSLGTPWPRDGRALTVVNAGCTPDLERARLYVHDGSTVLSMGWLDARSVAAAPPATRVAA